MNSATPTSVHDFTQRMVRCNLQNSLQPLGDESLAQDQSIQRFTITVLKDWLPRFSDQGNSLRVKQLCGQIKRFFTAEEVQKKVEALLAQIQHTCKLFHCDRHESWMDPIIAEAGLSDGPNIRFERLLPYLRSKSKERQIEFCQWVMSMLYYESEMMHDFLKLDLFDQKDNLNRNALLDEHTHLSLHGNVVQVSVDFPSDQVNTFDEVGFWLSYDQIKECMEQLDSFVLQMQKRQYDTQFSSLIHRFQAEVRKITECVEAISVYSPHLKRAGEKLLSIFQGRMYHVAGGCLRMKSKLMRHLEFAKEPDTFTPWNVFEMTAPLIKLFRDGKISSREAVNVYFVHFEKMKSFYEFVKAKRDSLINGPVPPKYNLSRIQNTQSTVLPPTIAIEPWVSREDRAILCRDELLNQFIKPPEEAPSAAPIKSKKGSAGKSQTRSEPLKPKTAEEKMQMDERKDSPPVSAWAPLPSAPIVSSRGRLPVPIQLEYDARVERWLADEADPANFPEYGGEPTLRDVCYHAFPLAVDAYLGDALEQVWINTTSGLEDRQFVIPAEIELPGSSPVRGVITYVVGKKDGLCYHRFFHEMETEKMVKEFGLHRFDKADFPALAAERPAGEKGKGFKPKISKKIQENPALGTVTFQDERTGSIVRIFRG